MKHILLAILCLFASQSVFSQYDFDPANKIKEITAQNGIESVENIYINFTGTDSVTLNWAILEDSLTPWPWNICDNKTCYFGPLSDTSTFQMKGILPAVPGYLKLSVTPDTKELRTMSILVWEVGNQETKDTLYFNVDSRPNGIFSHSVRSLNIYPSPANEIFKIEGIYGNASLSVLDISGKEVLKVENASIQAQGYNIEGLNPGLYNVILRQDNEVFTGKFVK